jgi:D-sedoheptulose 7-phosphate isomerase
MVSKSDLLKQQIEESIELRKKVFNEIDQIILMADVFINAFRKGNKVYVIGNGGSGADSLHLATELSGRFNKDRISLPAEALSSNISLITALANDYGFENIFAHQVKGIAKKGDILWGLSTGGNSDNIVRAFQAGNKNGTINIGFIGKNGGRLKEVSDYNLHVQSFNTARIQEMHLFYGHLLCGIIEDTLISELQDDNIKAIHPDMVKDN